MAETTHTSVKEDVIEMIRRLPDDCTAEDIQYHLAVYIQIEQGLRDIAAGNVYTHEEVMAEMRQRCKSSGRK